MADDDYSNDESIDSQLEWELNEGIPQMEDPFIEKYMAGRSALIEQEKKQRHDRMFKLNMTPIAKQAAKIVASIRKREMQSVWSTEYDKSSHDQSAILYPGMSLILARDRMQQTDLWKIIERMPKGALLHAHMDATIDIDWLIDQALNEPNYCVLAPESPSIDDKKINFGLQVKYCTDAEVQKAADNASIWSPKYVPQTLVHIKEAERTFPSEARTTFKEWLTKQCVITPEESLRHEQGVNAVWTKFLSCFRVIGSMLFYEPIWRRAMQRVLGQIAQDDIMYVDFRMAFVFEFRLEGKSAPETGYSEFFRIFKEELEKFKASEAGKSFQGARMIWTVIRNFGNKAIAESMKECIKIKQEYPELICGFDCVGQEDTGRTLADLTPLLFWFKKKCHEAGQDIPFFFHAGECLGDGDSTDNNLFDAILLGTRRIGHGYSLYKHPLLVDMVKEKKILVESCPISNEVLRLTSTILGHSLPALVSRGVAVSLNNDDPAILGTGRNGLTPDFWQACMGWENMGLEGLGVMAENSVRWCAVEDQKPSDWIKGISDSYAGKTLKAKMLREWRDNFEKWCQWIIMEYPLEADEDDLDLEGLEDEDIDEDE